jgi:hypothetical protein
MNAHDVMKALTFLHPFVSVTFPEQERNWKGTDIAKEKFSGMFLRMPTFAGSFEVLSQQDSGNGDGGSESSGGEVVTAACRFQCKESRSDSIRNMTYHIQDGHITEIHHL